jgi:hypothetical protein
MTQVIRGLVVLHVVLGCTARVQPIPGQRQQKELLSPQQCSDEGGQLVGQVLDSSLVDHHQFKVRMVDALYVFEWQMLCATSTAHHVNTVVVQLYHNHSLGEVYFLNQLTISAVICCMVRSEMRHPGVVKLMTCHSVEIMIWLGSLGD